MLIIPEARTLGLSGHDYMNYFLETKMENGLSVVKFLEFFFSPYFRKNKHSLICNCLVVSKYLFLFCSISVWKDM